MNAKEQENAKNFGNIKSSQDFPLLGQDPNESTPKYTDLIDFG